MESKKIWSALLGSPDVINSLYQYDNNSPFLSSWYLGTVDEKSKYKRGLSRPLRCHYIVPGDLWTLAHYIQLQNELLSTPQPEEKDMKRAKDEIAYFTREIQQLGPQIGLYWSPSSKKYLPVLYSVVQEQGVTKFRLTTQTNRTLSLSVDKVCVLGTGIKGSL